MIALALSFVGTVTIRFAPLPLPKALARLSAATGERLECAPALQNEVLLARLKDADEARVLQEIATTFDARWERRESRLVLLPDPVAQRRTQAARQAKRTAELEHAFAVIRGRLARQPAQMDRAQANAYLRKSAAEEKAREEAMKAEDYVEANRRGESEEESPSWRAAADLLALIGPKALLTMAPGERAVWSDVPTPMQRPFPGGYARIVRRYREEQRLVDPTGESKKILLSIERFEDGSAGTVALTAVGANGEAVDFREFSLTDEKDARTPPDLSRPGERPLDLTPELREYVHLMSGDLVDPTPRDASFGPWTSRLLDPAGQEPTGWLPGAGLVEAAQALDRNLIGTVPEYAGVGRPILPGETPSAFLTRYADLWDERDGWIVTHDEPIIQRVSRSDAATLLGQAVAQGGISIDAAADWSAAHPHAYPGVTWVGAHMRLLTSANAWLENPYYRFWHLLGPNGRAALRGGRSLALRGLSAECRNELAKKVYWEGEAGDDEPTERFPRGLPDGTVGLKIVESPEVVAWSSHVGEPNVRWFTSLTTQAIRSVRYPQREGAFDRYRIATTRRYTLQFAFEGGKTFAGTMRETLFDPKAAPLTALPDSLGKMLEAARERERARQAEP